MKLYKKLNDNFSQCLACRWYCKIPENFLGFCGVRANIKGKVKLLTENYSCAYHIDPIEKKPLYHFLPGAKIFSIGTSGCNFSCQFCQNWDISQTPKLLRQQLAKTGRLNKLVDKVVKFIKENSLYLPPEKIVRLALSYQTPSIAFTYNEPAIFAEYAYKTMRLAKEHHLFGVFVSSGYESKETLNLLEDYIDGYNIDIKAGSETFYQKISKTRLKLVLETVEEIFKRKKWLEITTLIIEGLNDSEKEIRFIARFIKNLSPDIPWHISAFYPAYKMSNHPPTKWESLKKAWEIGREEGLNYVYTGNIPRPDTESTYCPACGNLLIERFGYSVKIKGLEVKKGRCKQCGLKIPGIWTKDTSQDN